MHYLLIKKYIKTKSNRREQLLSGREIKISIVLIDRRFVFIRGFYPPISILLNSISTAKSGLKISNELPQLYKNLYKSSD